MRSQKTWRYVALTTGLLLPFASLGRAVTVDRIVGAVSPNGGSRLMKHFRVPAGAIIVGVEFVNNDLRTTFPRVALLHGQGRKLSEVAVLAEASNIRSVNTHVMRVSFAPIQVRSADDIYVALALPATNGVRGQGDGAGIGAWQRSEPGGSFLASAADGTFQQLDVDLAIRLLYQDTGKAEAGDDTPPRPVQMSVKAHPNPFNPSTTIEFGVPQAASVELGIYAVSGRLIRALVRENLLGGVHQREWDGRDENGVIVAGGIYLARLQVGEKSLVQKLVLMK
jgi:hypothetical protein